VNEELFPETRQETLKEDRRYKHAPKIAWAKFRGMFRMLKEDRRYAYVVLALLPIVLAILAVLINLEEISSNNHKFCQLLQAATAVSVPKPADPKANPSREKNYEGFVIFAQLGHNLGCEDIPIVNEGKK
jgi:hypothetical protein